MFTDKNVTVLKVKDADDLVKKSNQIVAENADYDIADIIVCRKTDLVYFLDAQEGHTYINVLRKLPEKE